MDPAIERDLSPPFADDRLHISAGSIIFNTAFPYGSAAAAGEPIGVGLPGGNSLDSASVAMLNISLPGLNHDMLGGDNNITFVWGDLYDYHDMANMRDAILSQFHEDLLTTTSTFTVILITLYTLAFIVGLLGNCTVIVVVLSRKQMRTVTNTFLVSFNSLHS